MKSIIQDLWNGNILPQEDSRNNSKEMKELMGDMTRHRDDFFKTLTDEQKEIFEKFADRCGEYASLAEESIFIYAFKLGAKIMMEAMEEKTL